MSEDVNLITPYRASLIRIHERTFELLRGLELLPEDLESDVSDQVGALRAELAYLRKQNFRIDEWTKTYQAAHVAGQSSGLSYRQREQAAGRLAWQVDLNGSKNHDWIDRLIAEQDENERWT